MRVLIIEDDLKIASVLEQALKEADFDVRIAHDGARGLAMARDETFDLAILDVMLPVMDGWQVMSTLRRGRALPVLMLTARDSVDDRVRGLTLGADDYLVKPFALPELLARVQSILRRGKVAADTTLRIDDLEVDLIRRRVTRAGKAITLSPKEFALLSLFMRRRGEQLTRGMIAREVWGIDFETDTNIVDVAVRRLRAKVESGAGAQLIRTVRGVGYGMPAHVQTPATDPAGAVTR